MTELLLRSLTRESLGELLALKTHCLWPNYKSGQGGWGEMEDLLGLRDGEVEQRREQHILYSIVADQKAVSADNTDALRRPPAGQPSRQTWRQGGLPRF